MATVTLNPGKERPLLQRHPWVFSGAVQGVRGYVGRGDVVDICDSRGEWLAHGTWSSNSQIRVRAFSWNRDDDLDEALLRERLQRAIAARAALLPGDGGPDTEAQRLVYAESDGLPGLIVDRYGDYLAIQLLTQGMDARAELVITLLVELLQPRGIYERSDADMRDREGLPPGEGLRWGEEPPEDLQIGQDGLDFYATLRQGQKTGFYLDQRRNRRQVAAYCAGREVLDCFCYTGGFTAYAARAGASQITAIDSSGPALAMLGRTMASNRLSTPVEAVEADVFKQLRQYRYEGRTFDVIILDPPKFAHAHNQIDRATRGYKDINLIAMQLLRPGGVLATFSCSGLISAELFQKVVFGAAVDARREVQVVERQTQAPDHPVLLTFPEGEYLKGLIARVW